MTQAGVGLRCLLLLVPIAALGALLPCNFRLVIGWLAGWLMSITYDELMSRVTPD